MKPESKHTSRETKTQDKDVDVKDSVVAVDVIPDSQQNTEHPTRPNTSYNKRNKETCLVTQNVPKRLRKPVKHVPDRYDIDGPKVKQIALDMGFTKITDQQTAWLVEYLNCGPDVKDREVTKKCGFHERTVGRWWAKQQWVDLVVKVAESRARRGLPRVWKALEDKAATGDVRALALYLQRFDGSFIRQTKQPAASPEDKARMQAAQQAIANAARKPKSIPLAPTGTNTK
jgi:hypothetical protein